MTALLKTDYQDSDCDHFLRTRIRRRTQGDNIGTKMNLSLSLFSTSFSLGRVVVDFFLKCEDSGGVLFISCCFFSFPAFAFFKVDSGRQLAHTNSTIQASFSPLWLSELSRLWPIVL